MNLNEMRVRQLEVCQRYGVSPSDAPWMLKVGVAENVKDGLQPTNALRHPASGDTTGWYIWAGVEFSTDAGYFKPLHVEHLLTWCPQILPYLLLPPGWRVLIAPGHEDVWEDPSLLDAMEE